MKKSEIETIITTTPEAIFTENVKSAYRKFIIVGFEQVKRSYATSAATFALVKDVYCSTAQHELCISEKVRRQPLRNIIDTAYSSPEAFRTAEIAKAERKAAASEKRKQQQELMNDIKPELKEALKACGVDNLQHNFGTMDTTFKIEVDMDNAEQLLKVLQAFAAQQVTA